MLVCDGAEKRAYPHSFRHMFCTNLAQAGVPLHVIQELSGLSQNAHHATSIGDTAGLKELEQRIDELAAEVWGLTGDELKEIQESSAELK